MLAFPLLFLLHFIFEDLSRLNVLSCSMQLLKGMALQHCPTYPSCASFIIIWWPVTVWKTEDNVQWFKWNCVNVTISCLLATVIPSFIFSFKNIVFCVGGGSQDFIQYVHMWVWGVFVYLTGKHCRGSSCGSHLVIPLLMIWRANSWLRMKLWLCKFYLYHSSLLPSWQSIEEPKNTMRRLTKASCLFEVWLYLYYQVNVQLCAIMTAQVHT